MLGDCIQQAYLFVLCPGRTDDTANTVVRISTASSMQLPQRPCLTDGEKQMCFRHLPDFVIFQLLRFDSCMNKISQQVQISAQPIDLNILDKLQLGLVTW